MSQRASSYLSIIAALVLFGAGCLDGSPTVPTQPAAGIGDELVVVVPEEEIGTPLNLEGVAEHSSKDDCWMVIDGAIYDVTAYMASHPGRDAILEGCGKDATELFETRPMGSGTPHSERARDMLSDYHIGELE